MKSVHFPIKPEHQAIRDVILGIPPGRVASYGEIAARAGMPGRARLVGLVLREAGEAVGIALASCSAFGRSPGLCATQSGVCRTEAPTCRRRCSLRGSRVDLAAVRLATQCGCGAVGTPRCDGIFATTRLKRPQPASTFDHQCASDNGRPNPAGNSNAFRHAAGHAQPADCQCRHLSVADADRRSDGHLFRVVADSAPNC